MLKKHSITALFVVLILACPPVLAFSLTRTRVIFSKGQDTWVKVTKANKKLRPLSHPVEISAQDVDRVLGSIRYFKPGPLSVGGKTGKEYDLFSQEEREMMAAPLSAALSQAGAEEWVDFAVTTFRGQIIIGSFRRTDGVMFVKDGELNIALRNIALKTAPDQEVNSYDPTKGYRSLSRLVKSDHCKMVEENWIAVPVKDIPGLPLPAAAPAEETPAAQPGVTPTEQAPPPEEKARPAKERLLELQELYDEGLISEEEYKKKREEILGEL